jgi:hypothetical protein
MLNELPPYLGAQYSTHPGHYPNEALCWSASTPCALYLMSESGVDYLQRHGTLRFYNDSRQLCRRIPRIPRLQLVYLGPTLLSVSGRSTAYRHATSMCSLKRLFPPLFLLPTLPGGSRNWTIYQSVLRNSDRIHEFSASHGNHVPILLVLCVLLCVCRTHEVGQLIVVG